MPSKAFYKIDSEKRKKIVEAMELEFGCNSFEKASVNKIVENAGISKGSFWFYFESKEEAINFIIDEFLKKESEQIIKLLEKNNGDIFKSYIEYYDYLSSHPLDKEKAELLPNIFKDLLVNDYKIIKKINVKFGEILSDNLTSSDEFNNILDYSNFKNPTKENILSMLKLLNFSLRSSLKDTFIEDEETEVSKREEFIRQIDILKNGI